MAMDDTDRVLLKGLMGFGVLAGVLYFYPFSWPLEGFRARVQKVEDLKKALEPKYEEYVRYYPRQTKAVIGTMVEGDSVGPIPTAQTAERLREYKRRCGELRKLIVEKEEASRMNFASWTEIPPMDMEKNSGLYFADMWEKIRNRLVDEARRMNVDITDQNIGFSRMTGGAVTMPPERAKEWLRQLFIAEKVITLCIQAKQEQEELERKGGLKPEAFVRVISVLPEDPVRIGPYSRTPNPEYNKDEFNPKSKRYQKYITREWDKFIRMYPVEIRLQCDINSFRNFLNAVRSQKGQFLVIRNLEIVSPFMQESKADASEWTRLRGNQTEDSDFKEEHVLIKLSAAGMDFFEPEKTTRKTPVPSGSATTRTRMPMGH